MTKLTLLYAEDDIETRENYTYVLKDYFDKVYTAENGKEALRIYLNKKPDVLLLDISMPLLNGLDMAKEVRRYDEEIPIIIFTAHSERSKLLQAVDLKLETYLLKPIDYDVLEEAILKVINEIKEKSILTLRDEFIWDKINSDLYYEKNCIQLTKKETRLMQFLATNIEEHYLSDDLIIYIWQDIIPNESHDNKLRQLVHRFHNKLLLTIGYSDLLIENTYAMGYKLLLK